jgi:hypothetical protein
MQNDKFENYFLKGMIKNAMIINDKEKMRKYVYMFYNISKTIESLARYFQDRVREFIAFTLYQF